MRLAYVDTSFLLAVAFGEPAAESSAARMRRFDRLVSSNLLEAEFRAALVREKVGTSGEPLLGWVGWIHPDRPLTAEFRRVLERGQVRGANLWHLACAMFLRDRVGEMAFLTHDERQQAIAQQLGFAGSV